MEIRNQIPTNEQHQLPSSHQIDNPSKHHQVLGKEMQKSQSFKTQNKQYKNKWRFQKIEEDHCSSPGRKTNY